MELIALLFALVGPYVDVGLTAIFASLGLISGVRALASRKGNEFSLGLALCWTVVTVVYWVIDWGLRGVFPGMDEMVSQSWATFSVCYSGTWFGLAVLATAVRKRG